ncbi:unnamed protein product, partial [marine sediment metagenome]
WEESPEKLTDRISNELLFQIWKLEKEKQAAFMKYIFSFFIKSNSWLITKKIKLALLEKPKLNPVSLTEVEMDETLIQFYSTGPRSKKFYPFLIIHEILSWILFRESIRLNAESFVSEWDREAKKYKQESRFKLRELNKFLSQIPTGKDNQGFIAEATNQLKKASPEIIEGIPRMIGEEERITKTINYLLVKAKDPIKKEEVFSLILEKIHPLMGIVTQTSPALLWPCLRLLMDSRIEISSGIQYKASLILSILQDSRSTDTLLKALNRFPLLYSKIRVNLIYTLGNLKDKKAL